MDGLYLAKQIMHNKQCAIYDRLMQDVDEKGMFAYSGKRFRVRAIEVCRESSRFYAFPTKPTC